MWRKVLAVLAILFFVAFGYSIFSYSTQEKPPKWSYTFDEYSKDPFAIKIFLKEVKSFFPNMETKKISYNKMDAFFLSGLDIDSLNGDTLLDFQPEYSYDSIFSNYGDFNYLSVNHYFNTNHYSANSLITHALRGGHVQLYAFDFRNMLKERLRISVTRDTTDRDSFPNITTEKVIFNSHKTFDLRQSYADTYFEKAPSKADTILITKSGLVKGLRFNLGYGSISLFTTPHLFTNYDLLYVDRKLAEELLTELPIKPTYWSSNLDATTQQSDKN